ncbi:MAG: hypothetical protein LBT27_06550 [Prevotellaceae bacterium]|jgi:hypothetical protein|nr:hypothetical protein [Prevotellaceae bacterium]
MALNKQTLAAAIKAAFDAESDTDVNPVQARQRMASAIADAVEAFVKSGTVTGTCATPAGAGTITGVVQ